MSGYVAVFVTASSREEAETIAKELVGSRLAACANIFPEIRSIFRWKGKVQKEQEVLLIIKSRLALFDRIEQRVRELHSYEVPEIVAVPIVKGSPPYLDWVGEETAD
ncbi:MAG: divalent-cation tolerance protein CutA [Nitrospirae bacterium CG08_land_8_20_14_0_20_52_24]|nr:MAG: hypothetical protein AUK29_04780 [Nitrospirae bacterium CG2_30_53_67]PIS37764.1 MAG: divalent-cation tolerance protein CutA [Nitrospirae bacterium CG08_land_8_20_14_0_20_52_24]